MSYANPITCPGYYLEQVAFNPKLQPENKVHKEVLARIAAIVAPIFHLFQVLLHGFCATLDSLCYVVGLSKGNFSLISSTVYSVKYFYFSNLEILQKFIFGPHKIPNYSELSERYDMLKKQPWQGDLF
ncbi:MAG: hypothetical protein K940chlam6_00418 [Chlamydiae bacterium]|nr:hypothetical protein [Chlamydiota bacterium]